MRPAPLPRWAEIGLIPVLNILLALGVSGIVIALVGESPFEALVVMVKGAFVYSGGLGYTLYYTTNFIFTGLAVSIAFHAMLFNIGGEGQAAIGGLGVALVCLALDPILPGFLVILLAIGASAAFGAAWALIPGYLQAYRGSHVVITTIMFNFIAAGLSVALLSGVLMRPGQSSPQTREFAEGAQLPFLHEMAAWLGIEVARSPLNFSFIIALLACAGVWVLIWRTKFGYALRAMGQSEPAAVYAGIPVRRMVVIAMALSGAMAGMMALNEILG
ncbi:MAG TPA: ABC transporter permease, partial [Thermohalobaculum sp.]|nr:ABC transporter permease [Thermohalobaculum sp.]